MNEEAPVIVDKRRNSRLLEEIGVDESTYKKTPNRLSPVRFPLGEEPWADVPGTEKDDGWVNVKYDVTEHADPEPNQRHLLKGGVELKLPCAHCGEPMHAAASKSVKEVLEEGGYTFKEDFEFPKEKLVACVCPRGHVTQLKGSLVSRLRRN